MNKINLILAGCLVAFGAVLAEDGMTTAPITNQTSVTKTTITPQKFTGFLDSVWLSASGNTTGTLTIASTLTGEKFLDAAVTGSVSFRPRVIPMWTNGLAASVGTNLLERVKLVGESLTFTYAETHTVTNVHTLYIRLSDK